MTKTKATAVANDSLCCSSVVDAHSARTPQGAPERTPCGLDIVGKAPSSPYAARRDRLPARSFGG